MKIRLNGNTILADINTGLHEPAPKESILQEMIRNGQINNYHSDGAVQEMGNWFDFIKEVKAEGLFHALYDKSFFEVMTDFFVRLGKDIGFFILNNGDLFFLMPAIILMFLTFFVGRNKYTKYILPCWFAYFAGSFFKHFLF